MKKLQYFIAALLIVITCSSPAYEIYQGPPPGKMSDTVVLVTPSGNPVPDEENMLGVANYQTLIGLGKVAGHSQFRGFGQRSALSTVSTGDDVWTGTATTIPVPDQTTGDAITCVSTSANDIASTGTNVQKIDVHYLDVNWNETHLTVLMNGVTPVVTGITGLKHLQYIHSEEVGSFGVTAAGTITCYRASDATRIYGQISVGSNVSLSSQRMVPAGKTFYMTYVSVSGASGKPLSVRLRATSDFEGILIPGIFIFNEVFFIQDSTIAMTLTVPRKFPEKSVIKATAFSTQAAGDVSVSYGGWVE